MVYVPQRHCFAYRHNQKHSRKNPPFSHSLGATFTATSTGPVSFARQGGQTCTAQEWTNLLLVEPTKIDSDSSYSIWTADARSQTVSAVVAVDQLNGDSNCCCSTVRVQDSKHRHQTLTHAISMPSLAAALPGERPSPPLKALKASACPLSAPTPDLSST